VLSSLLLVLLIGVAAAAQEQAPLVRVVALPGGGAELLLTRVDAVRGVASSQLVAPGGGQAAASVPSADGTAAPAVCCPQRFISRYKDVFGWFHQLMTQEEAGETAEAHALRHAAAVAVLVAEFPPAVSTTSLAPASIEPGEQVFKTSWHGADGLDHEVETARRPNETTEKWAQRHAEGVAAMLALFPPAPGFAAAGAGALRTVV
jgi:hypothetical protein